MYSKGDMVVYPIYGAGIIEEIQTNKVDGMDTDYYVLALPVGKLKIMVAVDNADRAGIRTILGSGELRETISAACNRPVVMNDNWNQRYKDHMDKIKSGDLQDIAEVFRNLRLREKERGLSSAEKKMLSNVKQIIVSEIILSCGVEKDKAEEILGNCINC